MVKNESSEPEILGRSVVAGVAGTVVMTVFQKLAEMPARGAVRTATLRPSWSRRSSASILRAEPGGA